MSKKPVKIATNLCLFCFIMLCCTGCKLLNNLSSPQKDNSLGYLSVITDVNFHPVSDTVTYSMGDYGNRVVKLKKYNLPKLPAGQIRIKGIFVAPNGDVAGNGYDGYTWWEQNKFGYEGDGHCAWFYADVNLATNEITKAYAYVHAEGRYTTIYYGNKKVDGSYGQVNKDSTTITLAGKFKWSGNNQGERTATGKDKIVIKLNGNVLENKPGHKIPFHYELYDAGNEPINKPQESLGVAITENY